MELSKFHRTTGEWLRGLTFDQREWRKPSPEWTHDHCEICQAHLREDPEAGDYSKCYVRYTSPVPPPLETLDTPGWKSVPRPEEEAGNPIWICSKCFDRYKAEFDWRVTQINGKEG